MIGTWTASCHQYQYYSHVSFLQSGPTKWKRSVLLILNHVRYCLSPSWNCLKRFTDFQARCSVVRR